MGLWNRRRKRRTADDFTQQDYEAVSEIFVGLLMDASYGSAAANDEEARALLTEFVRDGLQTLEYMKTIDVQVGVESKIAHEVAQSIAYTVLELGGSDGAVGLVYAAMDGQLVIDAADIVSTQAPAGRGDRTFAIKRAERAILEAAIGTFLAYADMWAFGNEGADHADVKALDLSAQWIGILWTQWMVWNTPYEFAYFKAKTSGPR